LIAGRSFYLNTTRAPEYLKLYHLLNKASLPDDEFSTFEQTRDDHFRLNCEKLELSYTDIFRNFLLSRQLFDEYFCKGDRDQFLNLLSCEKTEEAFDLYINIAKTIAKEKWLPKNFAMNQAVDIFIKFYLAELK
jgi:hypothetical protein